MLITDDFVMIHFPKTGTTFARDTIKKVYDASLKEYVELMLPIITDGKTNYSGVTSQHGTVQQIPSGDRNKQIISIFRNPFDRLISLYTFGWWKKYPPVDINIITERFPSFPDIDFREYLDLIDFFLIPKLLYAIGLDASISIGLNTLQYIQYFSYSPLDTLLKIADSGKTLSELKEDFPQIIFLNQENLREDLIVFLKEIHFKTDDLKVLVSSDKLNVSRPNDVNINIYDASTIMKVAYAERLLIELFHNF